MQSFGYQKCSIIHAITYRLFQIVKIKICVCSTVLYPGHAEAKVYDIIYTTMKPIC
jgi:hypothetical protein